MSENEEKADAVLKGTGQDTAFTESFQKSEGLNAYSQIALATTKYSNRGSLGLNVGENASTRKEERKHEAIATFRLVNKDGDVIWSTTQVSFEGKFLGRRRMLPTKSQRSGRRTSNQRGIRYQRGNCYRLSSIRL